jgi:hypothetical protein
MDESFDLRRIISSDDPRDNQAHMALSNGYEGIVVLFPTLPSLTKVWFCTAGFGLLKSALVRISLKNAVVLKF